MAEPKKKSGGRAPGWDRIAFDVPEGMLVPIAQALKRTATGNMKLMGTAALGLYIALPQEAQDELYRWALLRQLKPKEEPEFKEVAGVVLAIVAALQRSNLPPTESGGAASKKSGSGLPPGVIEIAHEPEKKQGFTVQRIDSIKFAPPFAGDRPEDKRADDKAKGEKGATG